jgi:uncharacterized protein YoxC
MDPVLLAFLCLALAAVAFAAVVAAWLMLDAKKQLHRSVDAVVRMSNDVNALRADVVPVLNDSRQLMQQLQATASSADQQLTSLSKGVEAVAGIATDVRTFEKKLLERVGPPLEDAADVVAGVSKGLTTFVRTLLKFRQQ